MSNFEVPEGCFLGFLYRFLLYDLRLVLGCFFTFRYPKALHPQHFLELSIMNLPFFCGRGIGRCEFGHIHSLRVGAPSTENISGQSSG